MEKQSKIESINFKSFLLKAIERLPNGSIKILKTLNEKGPLNMDQISVYSLINRSFVKTAIAPLEVLELVNLERFGQAKEYSITELGEELLSLIDE